MSTGKGSTQGGQPMPCSKQYVKATRMRMNLANTNNRSEIPQMFSKILDETQDTFAFHGLGDK